MSFSIHTDYPWWFYFFCIAAGMGYAWILYRKEKRFDETRRWVRNILPALRFAVVTLISFFLLSPLLKNITRTVEKPIIVFAQDNSESVAAGKDSAYYKTEYVQKVSGFISSLAGKYDTNVYSFGDKVRRNPAFDFTEKETDISSLFEELETRYQNRNVGAVIIASDGLYNKGQNPLYLSSQDKFPIYTIALGDTNVKKDLILSKALYNRIAYLGNEFPIEIQMDARLLKGQKTNCTVSKEKEILFSQQVSIPENNFSVSIPLQLEAKGTGIQRYTIRLSGVEGEASYSNNTKDIFIDVLDGRQKILILADAPHPDIAAIRNTLENNENYEADVWIAGDYNKPLSGYNLIILYQLPSAKNQIQKLLADIDKEKLPILHVLGSNTSVAAFNQARSGLNITNQGAKGTDKMSDAGAVTVKEFSLFTLSDALRNYIPRLPPLQCPFGNYSISSAGSALFNQQIGLVETRQPLVMFSQAGEQKTGIFCGEGIWRWRLQDFAEHGNHDLFNEFIQKTVQYLAAKADKSFFRVISKNNFYENEPVIFEAELYNDSYELINDPEINIVITDSDGKKFPFTFNKTAKSYRLDAGNFPAGNYRYSARVKSGTKMYSEQGEFSITALHAETTHTIADHHLLYQLARKSGGVMMHPGDLEKLSELLMAREDIKPISHSEKKLTDLINLKWIFFLILILLSLEWFIRKINGAY